MPDSTAVRPAPVHQSRLPRRLLLGATVACAATPAWAGDRFFVVFTSLALFGLVGGAVAGLLAGLKPGRVRFLPAFLVYLGLLSAVATTRAGSMEAMPITVVLGAAFGIVPFAAGYFALKAATRRLKRPPDADPPPG